MKIRKAGRRYPCSNDKHEALTEVCKDLLGDHKYSSALIIVFLNESMDGEQLKHCVETSVVYVNIDSTQK